MTARFHSPNDVIEVLRRRVTCRGEQNELAETLGVSRSYLSELLAGKKTAPGEAVLRSLGFDPTPHYRRAK